MDELIDVINKLAMELLQEAQDLDAQLGEPNPNHEALNERLHRICGALTKVVESLERESSPLRRLVRMLDGTLVAQALDRLEDYIADHRAALVRLRVPDQLIERVLVTLRGHAGGGENALDRPQTLRLDDAITPLKSLRDLVCGIANAADVAEILATPAVLKQIVGATLGAATIVVDVTGAAAASTIDPIGWVLVKAVKSVWAGATMVRSAVLEIKGKLKSLRETAEKQRVAQEQARMRAEARNHPFTFKKDDPGP